MYQKDKNGNRMDVKLNYPSQPEFFTQPVTKSSVSVKPEGSNKMLLYIALILGLIVLIGSGYLIYRYNTSKKSKIGYEI